MPPTSNTRRFARSGALAGGVSALVFTALHHLLISDIWFSLLPMLGAGAVCGLCIGWTYGLLFEGASVGSWLRYNLLYLALFVLLGVASVLVYEPVTTVAALMAANEPPTDLFRQAMPMTVGFTLAATLLVGLRYGRSGGHYAALLLTCTLLVTLLGLNVSVLGLVHLPGGSVVLVGELFALLLALNGVYVAVFIALERPRLAGRPAHAPDDPVHA